MLLNIYNDNYLRPHLTASIVCLMSKCQKKKITYLST